MKKDPLVRTIAIVICATACLPFVMPREVEVVAAIPVLAYFGSCVYIAWVCGREGRDWTCFFGALGCVIAVHLAIRVRLGPSYSDVTAAAIMGLGICSVVMLVPMVIGIFEFAQRRAWRLDDGSPRCECGL